MNETPLPLVVWAITQRGFSAAGVADSGALSDRLQGILRSRTFTIKNRKILYHIAGKGVEVVAFRADDGLAVVARRARLPCNGADAVVREEASCARGRNGDGVGAVSAVERIPSALGRAR